jgi:heat shock protein HtpX
MLMALIFAGAMNFFMYFASTRWCCACTARGRSRRPKRRSSTPWWTRLRQRAGLPMPTVAVAPQAQPNAFATGRNPEHAVVCVTEGF